MQIKKIKEVAPGELSEYVGIGIADEIDQTAPVVDIKLLKLAILHIEKSEPDAKSVRIGKAGYYIEGLNFLAVSTKTQELAEEPTVHIISPLCVHVDRADKFSVVEPQVFIGHEVSHEIAARDNNPYSMEIEEYADDTQISADEQKKRVVVEREPPVVATAGYKRRKKKPKEIGVD